MTSAENTRRRKTASWTLLEQLTPEQRADVVPRGEREPAMAGEVFVPSPPVLAATEALTAEAPADGEVRAALQRSIDRRG